MQLTTISGKSPFAAAIRYALKRGVGERPSAGELAAFYAELVNSDKFLPANTISNTLRDAMLVRGLVTPERLRARGVH